MNRIFTYAAASVALLSSLSASAASFDTYVADPEPGNVTELSTIKITFPDFVDVDILQKDAIQVMKGWTELDFSITEAPKNGNYITVTMASTKVADEYYVIFGDGSLEGYTAEGNSKTNSEFYLQYKIVGEAVDTPFNFDYTVNPTPGTVSSLSSIVLSFSNLDNVDFNNQKDIYATFNGSELSDVSMTTVNDTLLKITLPHEYTTPGKYNITVAKGALCGFRFDRSPNFLDQPEDIVLSYSIAGSASTVDFTVEPSVAIGSFVSELPSVDFILPNVSNLSVDSSKISVSLAGVDLNSSKYSVAATTVDGKSALRISFSPTIVTEDAQLVSVTIGESALTATKNGSSVSASNSYTISWSATVVPTVQDDLQFMLNKTNSDGELSAEKQLTSLFFSINAKGINPVPSDTPNVTVKQVYGDYEASGKLAKAYGFNTNVSYFCVDFGSKEPRENGEYTITMDAEIAGDAVWMANHQFGRTNAAQVLRFTLVDGLESAVETLEAETTTAHSIYNLQGIRISTPYNALPAGLYIVDGRKMVVR